MHEKWALLNKQKVHVNASNIFDIFNLFYLTFIYCGFALKKQLEETKNKKKREEKDATQKLKSTIIVSAVVAAVAGAVFALTKKLRENK